MLDTVAGITLGLFLLSVAVKGNTGKMVALAKRDKAFLQWLIAVGILAYLHGIPALKGPVKILIALAFLGLFLSTNKDGDSRLATISENVSVFWKSIGE